MFFDWFSDTYQGPKKISRRVELGVSVLIPFMAVAVISVALWYGVVPWLTDKMSAMHQQDINCYQKKTDDCAQTQKPQKSSFTFE